jgi:hypothetical protein
MRPVVFQLRIIQFVMVASVLMFFYVGRTLPVPSQNEAASFQWAIVACAFASALGGFIAQRVVQRASNQTPRSAQDSTQLSRWQMGHIIRFASAESVALFGFVLRSLGAPSTIVYSLFAGGIVLLLIWQPGAAPTPSEPQSSIG